jgi:hypothetical protein
VTQREHTRAECIDKRRLDRLLKHDLHATTWAIYVTVHVGGVLGNVVAKFRMRRRGGRCMIRQPSMPNGSAAMHICDVIWKTMRLI